MGARLVLADLGPDFWSHCPELDGRRLADIADLATRLLTQHAGLLISDSPPEGPVAIDSIPLSPRTAKLLRAAFGADHFAPREICFGALRAIPHVGTKRVLEIACALELVDPPQRRIQPLPAEIESFFSMMTEWCGRDLGHATLELVLPAARPDWPQPAARLWESIRKAATGIPAAPVPQETDSVPALLAREIAEWDDLTTTVLRARILAISESTRLEVLAAALGETPNRIIELESRGIELLERLRAEGFGPVLERAEEIRRRLGAAIPSDDPAVADALEWGISDFDGWGSRELAIELLLWLAGPYRRHEGWLLTGVNLVGRTAEALLEFHDAAGDDRPAKIVAALNEIGVLPTYHERWLDWVSDVGRLVELDRQERKVPDRPERQLALR